MAMVLQRLWCCRLMRAPERAVKVKESLQTKDSMQTKQTESILQKYSESQIKELKESFRLFDKDGDGSISTDELRKVLRDLGQYPSVDEIRQMVQEIDIDGDGRFSFEEFIQFMENMGGITENKEGDDDEELRQAFKMFDKSGTGYICASDLRVVIQCLGEDLTEEEIDEMIAEVDIDGDGRIDFEEFLACMCEDKAGANKE
ncbi:neo-calmodulin isoform X3 [Octopus bimaculoides]|uniref:neo-calmodulin isoform X3 n=1 Tax=Octopus bimaculoides TaxID=37653 RepID=UPI00071C66F5|nr:neo-calmodulin isoform X3 [Octopus bimaculoides]|eukprot:XP_014771763.1 PREDICTED: neo-calmodulin-like isoform X1 [Octopus bimaculoides]